MTLMRNGISEKRAEPRLWCSDLIRVYVEGTEPYLLIANLEDISPRGACVQLEEPVTAGAQICLMLGRRRFQGEVKYCLHNEIGYFAGVHFNAGRQWSREVYEPKHLLDPARLAGRKG